MNPLSKISRRSFTQLALVSPFLALFPVQSHGLQISSRNLSELQDAWLVGGTDRITIDYPNDEIFESADPCKASLPKRTTLGPCYFKDTTGEDISLGLKGLPMQLCLRLIDTDCQPLQGYTIEIWHCDTRGVYSADISDSPDASRFAGGFCSGGNSAAKKSSWYRGMLKTDGSGRVNFKTNFPGWYPGRTIHIHYAISDRPGRRRFISQFCFTDQLAKAVCTSHPLYADRGEQDRPLAGGRDGVFPRKGYEAFYLNTRQNSDGSLLAFQTIQIK